MRSYIIHTGKSVPPGQSASLRGRGAARRAVIRATQCLVERMESRVFLSTALGPQAGLTSPGDTVTVLATIQPPAAPTVLTATAVSSGQINLSWTDNATTETGFAIDRATNATFTLNLITSTVGPSSGGSGSASITGLSANTTYYFRVRATNDGGASGNSNTASATTPRQPPAAPTFLTATAVSAGQINLSWTDNSIYETGFAIDRATDVNFTQNLITSTVADNGSSRASTSVTGLSANTTYYFRVRAFNDGGASANSNTASATTTSGGTIQPPAAPTVLTATAVSSGQINLSWTDNATTETGFAIDRATNATFTLNLITSTVGPSSGGSGSASITGLSANTTYYFRVRATNDGGASGNSNTANATTTSGGTIQPPAAPTVLAATAVSSGQINLSWTDNATSETGFAIDRATNATFTLNLITSTVGPSSGGSGSASITGLSANTTYYFRVRATNDGGASGNSNTASATTPRQPPAAPTFLTATAVSAGQINLSWTDNSIYETGFAIDRATDVNFTQNLITSTVADNGSSRASTSVTGLSANTTYYFRVRAFNDGGASANSNTASATTTSGGTIQPPAAPTVLTATAVSSGQINLSWTDNATSETGFAIDRATDINFTQNLITNTVGANSGSRASTSITGLSASTTYYFRVRAFNDGGASGNSNTASATTTSGGTIQPPAAPTVLTATAVSSGQINLSWTDNATSETGFAIDRATNATFTLNLITSTVGANSGSSASTAITGLSASTTYYFRVRAFNDGGTSGNSNMANATTTAATATGQITWTTFTPSADTRMVYVSSSTGNDGNNGLDASHPVATLAKGYSLLRNGYPDWLRLKAGDTWTNETFSWTVSGRSTAAPMLMSSYGIGSRPTISESGDGDALAFYGATTSHIALSGINFLGQGAGFGIHIYTPGTDYLVENCVIEGFLDNIVAQPDTTISQSGPSNVRIRGSQILNAYNASGPKSQGLFAADVDGMLLEYNVLDHNGWKTGAQTPDIYSHDAYLDDMTNLTIRSNVFSNASSFGLLVRSENAPSATQHVLIEDNLFVGDGNGMSVGARTGYGTWLTYGAVDVTIRNNVLTEIGRTLGGTDQSYGIDLGSINGGLITNNLLFNKPNAGTSFGIRLVADTPSQNVTISGNVIYNWNQGCIEMGTGPLTNIVVTGNVLQDNLYGSALQVTDGAINSQVKYSNNTYFSNAAAGNWFRVNNASLPYTTWISASRETGAAQGRYVFSDASRTVESYSALIGGSNTVSSLLTAERSQSQAAWRPELAADSIISYLDRGFGIPS